MKEVFHNRDDVALVDETWITLLKARALQTPLRRSRLCLHRAADDVVQEMIIVMCKDVLVRPHRHKAKTESFHMIEGILDIVLFDDKGGTEKIARLGPLGSGHIFCYRLCVSQFHAVLPLSEFVVMCETTTGPWVQDDAEFAPWAPTDPIALRVFLEDSVKRARVKGRVRLPEL